MKDTTDGPKGKIQKVKAAAAEVKEVKRIFWPQEFYETTKKHELPVEGRAEVEDPTSGVPTVGVFLDKSVHGAPYGTWKVGAGMSTESRLTITQKSSAAGDTDDALASAHANNLEQLSSRRSAVVTAGQDSRAKPRPYAFAATTKKEDSYHRQTIKQ